MSWAKHHGLICKAQLRFPLPSIWVSDHIYLFSPLNFLSFNFKIIILRGSTYDQKNEKSELLINHIYSILGNATCSNCVLIFSMYSPGNTPEFNKCHLCKRIYTVYPILRCFYFTKLNNCFYTQKAIFLHATIPSPNFVAFSFLFHKWPKLL